MSNESNLRPHIIIKDEPAPPVKREYSPGGSSYPREDYQKHATKVTKEADDLRLAFANSEDSSTGKVFFRLELPEDYKAESSKGRIIGGNLRAEIVGSPKENVAHVSTSRDSFNDLTKELEKYKTSDENTGKSKFSEVEGISSIPFDEKVTQRFLDSFIDESEGEALVELFPDMSNNDVRSVSAAVKKFVENKGGEVLSQSEVSSGKVFKVRSKKSVLEELAKMFVSIQAIDSVDQVIEYEAILGDRLEEELTVIPNDSKAYACVIDTGIVKNSRFLEDSILAQEFPFGDNRGVGVGHGTFVSSRIIFGDDLKSQVAMGSLTPDVKVVSICTKEFDVNGSPMVVTVDRLISVLRSTVEKWSGEIKVYNLSIGCVPSRPGVVPGIKDDVVHPLAAEIDFLSKKYDVLFVISAGNYPHNNVFPTSSYPEYFKQEAARILSPGESMLGITVGSIAKESITGSMAIPFEPSPFTRRGPGFNNYRKPDIATHGGNLGSGFRSLDYLMSVGLNETGDSIAYGNGTSFAAPIVTRLAAKLFERIPDATAPLVKALLLHASEVKESPNFSIEDLTELVGNGVPDSDVLSHSTKHSQTYLYQGEMDYRDMIEVPFYVPKGLVNRKGRSVVNVRATVVFFPETSKVLRKGYCKSHIRTKMIKLDANGAEKGVAFSQSKEFDSGRYSSVIKMNQAFSSKASGGDWKILIAHESRWTLKEPKTKFAVVISIDDPKREDGIDIYQLIRNEVSNRYQAEVRVRDKIKV